MNLGHASLFQFDLERALDAVVLVRSEVPADGYTAATLGTERGGHGIVIREDGLVLTIGYLINERRNRLIRYGNNSQDGIRAER